MLNLFVKYNNTSLKPFLEIISTVPIPTISEDLNNEVIGSSIKYFDETQTIISYYVKKNNIINNIYRQIYNSRDYILNTVISITALNDNISVDSIDTIINLILVWVTILIL